MSEVKITMAEYENLIRANRKLNALESAGVDNWEWYDDALEPIRKEDEYEDLLDSFVDSILEECSVNGEVEYPAGRECGHSILLGNSEESVKDLLRQFYVKASKI